MVGDWVVQSLKKLVSCVDTDTLMFCVQSLITAVQALML